MTYFQLACELVNDKSEIKKRCSKKKKSEDCAGKKKIKHTVELMKNKSLKMRGNKHLKGTVKDFRGVDKNISMIFEFWFEFTSWADWKCMITTVMTKKRKRTHFYFEHFFCVWSSPWNSSLPSPLMKVRGPGQLQTSRDMVQLCSETLMQGEHL